MSSFQHMVFEPFHLFTEYFLTMYHVTGIIQNTKDMKLAKAQSSKGNTHKVYIM